MQQQKHLGYLKYKKKYIDYKNMLKQQIGGMATKILLDGNSSVGKTTISKQYEAEGYKRIAYDDFRKEGRINFFKTVPNEYMSRKDYKQAIEYKIRDLMYDESKKYPKVIFDYIHPSILENNDSIFVITVYAPLENVIRNMISRQMIEYRTPSDVFTQFSDRYVKSDSHKNGIDIINREKFIELLKKIKYEFDSENDLKKFAENFFAKMNIFDDNDHSIMLREKYKTNHIINIGNKNPQEIYDELKKVTNEYNYKGF